MASTIAKYQKGVNLTAITLTVQTVAADGTLSDGTAYALTAEIEEVDLGLTKNLEEVSPVNATFENYHPVIDSFQLRLNVLTVNDTSDPNELALAYWNNDYFKLVYVVGTETGSIETITLYCVGEDLSTGVKGKGRQIATLTLRPILTSGVASTAVRGIA